MKPIEIRIEGYKIVITKDDDPAEQEPQKVTAPDTIHFHGEPNTGKWWTEPYCELDRRDVVPTTTTATSRFATGGKVISINADESKFGDGEQLKELVAKHLQKSLKCGVPV